MTAAGLTSTLPVSFNGNTTWIRVEGHPYNGEHNEVNFREVSAAYFDVLQTPLIRGRLFAAADDASHPPVAIINAALARRYFPGEDPIGRRIGDTSLSPDRFARSSASSPISARVPSTRRSGPPSITPSHKHPRVISA